MTIAVSTFYRFVSIEDCVALRDRIATQAAARAITGTILIAAEGINATIAGTSEAVSGFLDWLRDDNRFAGLETRDSVGSRQPFRKLKVKVRPEIVTFGRLEIDPSKRTGTHVDAKDWNDIIRDPGVVVIDTRNSYEVALGTFEGATDPSTANFSDFADFVTRQLADKKSRRVAMFCTGGIRCEKASAFLLEQGFTDVVQLKGGILRYLETVPPEQSLWNGACFVFDGRVSLQHGLHEGNHQLCRDCGFPIATTACGNPACGCTQQSTVTMDAPGTSG